MGVGIWRERLRQNAELGRRMRGLAVHLTPAELAVDMLTFRSRMLAEGTDLSEQLRCATAVLAYRAEVAVRIERGES